MLVDLRMDQIFMTLIKDASLVSMCCSSFNTHTKTMWTSRFSLNTYGNKRPSWPLTGTSVRLRFFCRVRFCYPSSPNNQRSSEIWTFSERRPTITRAVRSWCPQKPCVKMLYYAVMSRSLTGGCENSRSFALVLLKRSNCPIWRQHIERRNSWGRCLAASNLWRSA